MEKKVVKAVKRVSARPGKTYNLRVTPCHNYFANGILVHNCDDLHNVKEAESQTVRNSVLQYFQEVLPTRLTDPKTSAIVVIMQRVHEEDVSGYILEHDLDYTHLMLPMEFDPQRKCITYRPNGDVLFEDPRTEPNELLFPQRFPDWVIERDKKVLGPYASAGQFQQIPVPRGGGIIKREWWQVWPPEEYQEDPNTPLRYPAMDYIIMSCDTAYTSKQENDFSACVVLGVFKLRGVPKIMLMEAWQERLEFHDLVQKIIKTAKKRKVDAVLLEAKASGLSVKQEIVRLCGEQEFSVHPINPGAQDKVARAHAIVPLFAAGCIYAPEKQWAENVITEVAKFPKGAHDDMCDSLTQGVSYLRKCGLALLAAESDTIRQDKQMFRGGEDNEPLYDV